MLCHVAFSSRAKMGRVYTVQGVVNLPAPSALKTVKSKSINQPVQILPTSCAEGDTRATVGRWANRRWQMERKTQPKNRVPVVCVCVAMRKEKSFFAQHLNLPVIRFPCARFNDFQSNFSPPMVVGGWRGVPGMKWVA